MSRFINPVEQYFTADVPPEPMVGGSLTFYEAGTFSFAATYSDPGLTIQNPLQISLDAQGRPVNEIFLLPDQDYRVILRDFAGVIQFDRSPVTGFVDQTEFTTLSASLTAQVTALANQVSDIVSNIYAVGDIITTQSLTNPADKFGGTWSKIGAGRCLFGQNAADPQFDAVNEAGGAATVTLSSAQIPPHRHLNGIGDTASTVYVYGSTALDTPGGTTSNIADIGEASNLQGVTSSIVDGGSGAITAPRVSAVDPHNNLPPYLVVIFWIRTS